MFGRFLLVALVGTFLFWSFLARSSDGAGRPQHYVVKPGDTLWSIATSHYAGDPRDAIYRIDRSNHLRGSVIVPGQKLVLP